MKSETQSLIAIINHLPGLLGWQLTPTSPSWPQSWTPGGLDEQMISLDSLPKHWTSVSQILPTPSGVWSECKALASAMTIEGQLVEKGMPNLALLSEECPNCLQTTMASLSLQDVSHTVPHKLLKQTSTRPERAVPSLSLTSPYSQPDGGEGKSLLLIWKPSLLVLRPLQQQSDCFSSPSLKPSSITLDHLLSFVERLSSFLWMLYLVCPLFGVRPSVVYWWSL